MEEQQLRGTERKVHVAPTRSPAPEHRSALVRQCLAALIVNLLAFTFGTSLGWMSPVTGLLKSDKTPLSETMGEEEISWMGSLMFIGGIVGTLIWGRIADRWGRKTAGYAVSVPLIVGWSFILFSSHLYVLYAARFILGSGGTGGFIVGPLYVGEMAQDSLRGPLGSFVILFMNTGVLYAYCLGELLSYRIFTLACLTIPFVFLTFFYFMPESPVYLWSQGKRQDAERSLEWFRGGNLKIVEEECSRLAISTKKEVSSSYKNLVSTPGNIRATIIGLSLFCFQQFCGILVILSYAVDIFVDAGSSITPGTAAILVAVSQLGSSVMSSILVDKIGRKLLLLISYFFMFISLLILGFYFKYLEGGSSWPGWVPIFSLVIYVVCYALGSGPVTYVIISEILAPNIRGLAMSTFVLWGTSLAFASVKIFPGLKSIMGTAGSYWFFSCWSLGAVIFTVSLVPETKGISIEHILAQLNGQSNNDIEFNTRK